MSASLAMVAAAPPAAAQCQYRRISRNEKKLHTRREWMMLVVCPFVPA
jgi:hypothetical protein